MGAGLPLPGAGVLLPGDPVDPLPGVRGLLPGAGLPAVAIDIACFRAETDKNKATLIACHNRVDNQNGLLPQVRSGSFRQAVIFSTQKLSARRSGESGVANRR